MLRVGRTLFVGRSARTNEAGIARLAAVAEPLGYRVVPVPVTGCLHLKSAVTALDDERLLVNPAWLDTVPFARPRARRRRTRRARRGQRPPRRRAW